MIAVGGLSLVEGMLIVIMVSTAITAAMGVWIVARYAERRGQAELRHRLKAEVAALRLLLDANGIVVPNGDGDDLEHF